MNNNKEFISQPIAELQQEGSILDLNGTTTQLNQPIYQDEILKLKDEITSIKNTLNPLNRADMPFEPQNLFAKDKKAFINEVKSQIEKDFAVIDNLKNTGTINQKQAHDLKKQVQEASLEFLNSKTASVKESSESKRFENLISYLEKQNPDIFKSQARQELKQYLMSSYPSIEANELNHIIKLVENIEASAIDMYKKQAMHENMLFEENNSAKNKLYSNVLKNSQNTTVSQKQFSREEIGKMSPDEFMENEPEIMIQLKNGLIK